MVLHDAVLFRKGVFDMKIMVLERLFGQQVNIEVYLCSCFSGPAPNENLSSLGHLASVKNQGAAS